MKKLILLMALLAPAVASAQGPPERERREQLEAQIIQRFLNHASNQLGLDDGNRTRLEQHLRSTAPRRRNLALNTVQLRTQMLRAVRDSSTSDAEFTRLINEMTRLRAQEEEIWKSDQEALSRILTPRQHARFVVLWIRFNEQVRDMAMGRGDRGPGAPARGLQQPIRRP